MYKNREFFQSQPHFGGEFRYSPYLSSTPTNFIMKPLTTPSLAFLSLLLLCSSFSLSGQISLQQEWETPADLKAPESVIYDPVHEVLYVSNINDPSGGADGNGSIAKISPDGSIQEVEWVSGGMDAPKGLGLRDNLLYVADPHKVLVIDTDTGEILKSIEVKDAGMLNDISIDEEGDVYVSDSKKANFVRIRDGQAEVWLEDDSLQSPNGLLAHEDKLYMVDMGSGIFYEIAKDTKELRPIAEGLKGGDGIVALEDGFLISNWNGEIWQVTAEGEVTKLLDTQAEKINAADIGFLPGQDLLLVPTFFANKLVAYKLKD